MIEADKLTVTFRRGPFRKPIVALQRFSIQVQEADIFGLLGPNGAGKSTALYCLLGLIHPNHGTVRVLGESPQPGSPLFEGVAYVPEEPHYHLYLTVEEAVSYYGSLYRNEVSKTKVNEAIQRVGLTEFRDLKLSRCSKGMKQKVGIATCLLTTPRLVFLDEPTRGLDPVMTRQFREILLDLNRQGSTIFINSHMLSEVESVCNRVAIMRRGRVLVQNEMSRLLSTDSDTYAVECEAATNLPMWFTAGGLTWRGIRGLIPRDQIYEFFHFAQQTGIRVYECILSKASLEEAFLRVNLKFYVRNRLLAVLALALIFMMGLFAIPSLLVSTAGQKLAVVQQIVTQLSFFGTLFTALLGLLAVSHHLHNRSLKMVITKPCPLEVWLLAHFLSAGLVAAALYTLVFLIGSTLAAAWGVPVLQGLAAMMAHDLLQAVSLFAFLVFLTTIMHPALAAVGVLLFQEGTFRQLLVWLLAGLDIKDSASTRLFFSGLKYLFQAIYFVLPSWSPFAEKLLPLGRDLEFKRNQLPFLLYSVTYWLLLCSFCYLSAAFVLRRKRFA